MFDILANQSVDALEVVPETLHGFYEEADGKFVLSSKVSPFLEALKGSAAKINALSKQKGDDNRKDAARRTIIEGITSKLTEAGIEIGEGFDIATLPDLVGTKLTELMSAVKTGKDVNVNLEAIKKQFEKQLSTEKTKYDSELSAMSNTLHKYMVNNAALEALTKADAVANGAELLMPHISKQAKVIKGDDGEYVVRVVDEGNNVRLNNKGEPMSIADVVEEMKTKYPANFKSKEKPGGGSVPGTAKGGQKVIKGAGDNENRTPVQKIAAALATQRR